MKLRFLYLIISFLSTTALFGQERFTKNDSATTKLEKYQVGHYIKFEVDLGVVINESYSNKPYADYTTAEGHGPSQTLIFSPPGKKYNNLGFCTGLNFALGASPLVKHLIGVNYVQSQSEFDYYYRWFKVSSANIDYDNVTQSNIKTTIHYVNFTTGIRLIIFKRIYFDQSLSLNVPAQATSVENGTQIETYYDHPAQYVNVAASTTTKHFVNEKSDKKFTETSISYVPRVSYQFNIKKRKLCVYYSYNFSPKYNLPWHRFGLTFFPIKKLK